MEIARFFGFLHPALVHFPLVLLLVSVGLEAVGFFKYDSRFTWAARIILILGTTATLFAFVAGNFAEIWAARDGIPQDPMEYHELLATITSWTFVFLTAGRLFLVGKHRKGMALYLIVATAACVLLALTGHQGAMLVYNHGAGIHTAGLPPLATHEDMAVLLQKQDPDALFYSNKMHHVFGWMVLLLSLMLLTDIISPRWGDRLRRFAPLLLLAGGVFLMIFSDQDAWPLYQIRPFRPWSDKEVLMHKTYAILMLVFGLRGLWQFWRGTGKEKGNEKSEDGNRRKAEGSQFHARMMAIFALVGGALLFTHVHSNAPYANVAAGVYIHHTVMGFIALCIGAVKLIEDSFLQQEKYPFSSAQGFEVGEAGSNASGSRKASTPVFLSLPRILAWVYPCLILIESIFLINYNEGLPWFLGFGNLSLSAPHGGLIAPLGQARAELVYHSETQQMDVYLLDRSTNRPAPLQAVSMQALVKVGTESTAVDLVPDVTDGLSAHFMGNASFLRNAGLFQVQALLRPATAAAVVAPLVADFEPWIDTRLTAPPTKAAYVCPMHEAVGAASPGKCMLCGMDLIPNRPPRPVSLLADDTYRMDFAMYDAPPNQDQSDASRRVVQQPNAQQTVLLDFTPRHKDGSLVNNLAIVHTKPLHLIIASRDLSYFDHVHPVLQSGGDLQLEYRFPQPGEYLLYADCTPTGDRNQVFRIPVTVTGKPSPPRPLVITAAHGRLFGAYRVALTMTPDPPQTNDETELLFTISKDGVPVSDLEPFLGAGGHCVILSEDTKHYLHSHPLEMTTQRFGPTVSFHTRFPHAGIYKIWAQFQQDGKPWTADFVVRVP